MPRFLAHENKSGVPSNALWLTNVIVQVFLILTLFTQSAFRLALELTSSMILVPYLLVAAYGFKLAWTNETYENDPASRRADWVRATIALIYTAGLIYAAGTKHLLLSAAIYGPSTILFFMARMEQRRKIFAPIEKVVFGVVALGAIAAIYGIAAGIFVF